jgi:hypothetical protein
MISDRAMVHAINSTAGRRINTVVMVTIAERSATVDQAAPPPSLAVPNTAASPASPPRRALPPRPLKKPESGGDAA